MRGGRIANEQTFISAETEILFCVHILLIYFTNKLLETAFDRIHAERTTQHSKAIFCCTKCNEYDIAKIITTGLLSKNYYLK